MKTLDEGALDRLHDIVAPPPAPWWPPAPGWYFVFAFLLLFVGGLIWRLFVLWHRNRYRRAGLAELATLEANGNSRETTLSVAELVKRVALVAYGRERVASLTGQAWLAFLDASEGTNAFTAGAGRTLEDGYRPGAAAASGELFSAVRHWIKRHRADPPC